MIDILMKAAEEGGKILLKHYRSHLSITHKTTHHNIVTQADIEAQKIIVDTILQDMKKKGYEEKEIGFLGEEDLFKKGRYTFVIDPLDGTANFASGFEYFCVSIALFVDGKLTDGLNYLPYQNICYYATKNKGAYKIHDGKTIRLRMIDIEMKKTYMSGTINSKYEARQKQFKIYDELLPFFRGFMGLNALQPSLCLVAENIIGFMLGNKPHIWDIASGKIIIEESGGILTDWKGNDIVFDLNAPEKTYPTIATHKDFLSQIISATQKYS
jgi:myo-inositol-1(or 4)-monophosphatase